jgi:transposase-like protein
VVITNLSRRPGWLRLASIRYDARLESANCRRITRAAQEIIQGKTTVAEASRAHDLPPSEIEKWVDDGKRGMENALRANPQDLREQYEKQLRDLQEAYGEAMLELRARKNAWSAPRLQVSSLEGAARRSAQMYPAYLWSLSALLASMEIRARLAY